MPGAAHVDRTSVEYVTLDPASATDLDQAFAIEQAGDDIVLHYAIADVGFFVDPGSVLDRTAWERGGTVYLPDGKVPLYPPALSEAAASLLPDGTASGRRVHRAHRRRRRVAARRRRARRHPQQAQAGVRGRRLTALPPDASPSWRGASSPPRIVAERRESSSPSRCSS